MINTIDPEFFERNIPEAFMIRKEVQAEKQNKIVDMLPFFYNMITHSNMIGNGNYFNCTDISHYFRQQERQGVLRLPQSQLRIISAITLERKSEASTLYT